MPSPHLKASEFIRSINEMVDGGINNDRLEEIAAEAKKMKERGQYTDGCIVLGMIAAMRLDADEVDKQFNAAIRNGGRIPFTLTNYALVLSNLGRHIDAIKIIDEVYEQTPDDLFLIKKAISFHSDAFDVDGFHKFMARIKALDPSVDYEILEDQMIKVGKILEEHKVTWQDASSRVEIAYRVLQQFGMPPRFADRRLWDGIIMHKFLIHGEADSIYQAESALVDAIANQPYSPVDDFLYFSCASV